MGSTEKKEASPSHGLRGKHRSSDQHSSQIKAVTAGRKATWLGQGSPTSDVQRVKLGRDMTERAII